MVTGGKKKYLEAIKHDGSSLCVLDNLPEKRKDHTINGDIICGGSFTGSSCIQFKEGNWDELEWQLIHERSNHIRETLKVHFISYWYPSKSVRQRQY